MSHSEAYRAYLDNYYQRRLSSSELFSGSDDVFLKHYWHSDNDGTRRGLSIQDQMDVIKNILWILKHPRYGFKVASTANSLYELREESLSLSSLKLTIFDALGLHYAAFDLPTDAFVYLVDVALTGDLPQVVIDSLKASQPSYENKAVQTSYDPQDGRSLRVLTEKLLELSKPYKPQTSEMSQPEMALIAWI